MDREWYFEVWALSTHGWGWEVRCGTDLAKGTEGTREGAWAACFRARDHLRGLRLLVTALGMR